MMPTKKRKYNARFPAGRIKKIMQTDEEVGKVAQAVPIIISRTLELFVESLLAKAVRVTLSRNAKTMTPSHIKQCILAESRFDFLKDQVECIPDVSAAEDKEMLSAESSPNCSRFPESSAPLRRTGREDSSSSGSSDIKLSQLSRDTPRQAHTRDSECHKRTQKPDAVPANCTDMVIDLSKKPKAETKPRTANFYQETLVLDDTENGSVIKVNPTYTSQPSTSTVPKTEPSGVIPKPDSKQKVKSYVELRKTLVNSSPVLPKTKVAPVLNIDFSKNIAKPEIKVLDTAVANLVGVIEKDVKPTKTRLENKFIYHALPLNVDGLNSGNLQIDEDYDT